MSPKMTDMSVLRKRKLGSDYRSLCRLCLMKTSMKVNMFHEEGMERDIKGKILNCLSLIVSQEDNLPNFVCHSCVDKLENFYDFRTLCHEAENILTAFVSSEEKRQRSKRKFQNSDPPWSSSQSQSTSVPAASNEKCSLPKDYVAPVQASVLFSEDIVIKDEMHDASYTSCEESPSKGTWHEQITVSKVETTSGLKSDIPGSSGLGDDTEQYTETSVNNDAVLALEKVERVDEDMGDSAQIEGPNSSEMLPSGHVVVEYSSDTGHYSDTAENYAEGDDEYVTSASTSNSWRRMQRQRRTADGERSRIANRKRGSVTKEKRTRQAQGEKYCEHCKKRFVYEDEVEEHLKYGCTPNSFPCILCNKVFKKYSALKEHVNTHFSELNTCKICGKCFTQRVNLRRHLKLHSGSKPFVCNVCGKPFTRKEHLTYHLSSHTRNPYMCELCPRVFPEQGKLTTHLVTVHGRL